LRTTHNLEAEYQGGDILHAKSHGTLPVVVRSEPNTTETKLRCQPASPIAEEGIHCSVTVTEKGDKGSAVPLAGAIVSFEDTTERDAGNLTPTTCTLELVAQNSNEAICEAEVEFKSGVVAEHVLKASFPGDDSHATSSDLLPVQVRERPHVTQTALHCKETILLTDEAIHCTATVIDTHDSPSSLTGTTVSFEDTTEPDAGNLNRDTCTLKDSTTTAGEASCEVEVEFKSSTAIIHQLKATFQRDGDNHFSSSDTRPITVKNPSLVHFTETKLSCQSPAVIAGGAATHCTVSVADKHNPPSSLTGDTVSFEDTTEPDAGNFTPPTCTLKDSTTTAGEASCEAEVEFKSAAVAEHVLKAAFPSDAGDHFRSSSMLSVAVQDPHETETTLSCERITVHSDRGTHCTAKVIDKVGPALSLAGATVSFKDIAEPAANNFSPPTCTLAVSAANPAEASCETEFKSGVLGEHELKASYPGDGGTHLESSGTLSVTAVGPTHGTETELTCRDAAVNAGQVTHCTAKVIDKADPPSSLTGGIVSFKDATAPDAGNLTPPTCTLKDSPTAAGEASCETEVDFKSNAVGNHTLQASYPDDGDHRDSQDGFSVQVNPHATKTTLACNPTSLVLGAAASQCTATVEDTTQTPTHPSGEVQIAVASGEGTLAAKSCNLPANGAAKVSCPVITFTPAKVGSHELKASYPGDGTHAAGSGTAKLTVEAKPIITPPPAAAPDTILGKKPRPKTTAPVAVFSFTSNQPGTTFQCKVDKKPAKPCTSPFKVKKLKPGRHTFTVQAVNAQGLADQSPVVYKWTVGPAKKRPRR
jgi:Bacterial Ig-like domain (group 3)